MLVGYARVSLPEQQLALQEDALRQAGCENIYPDTVRGKHSEHPGLTQTLEVVRTGDTLVVWKLDRLGRSLAPLMRVMHDLQRQGIHVQSLQEDIDTTSGVGPLVCHPLAALAEVARDLIRERTLAG